VICLSEGFKIYDGATKSQIRDYFATFGLKMSKYANPADKISNIAAMPTKELRDGITIRELAQYCKQ
jgi:hypothetical protein